MSSEEIIANLGKMETYNLIGDLFFFALIPLMGIGFYIIRFITGSRGKKSIIEPYCHEERSSLDPLNPINHGFLPGDVGYKK